MTEQKRYIVSSHKIMQNVRVVWSMSEEDLFKSWTETFADLLNAETAPLLERIAELENTTGYCQTCKRRYLLDNLDVMSDGKDEWVVCGHCQLENMP